MHLPPRGVFIMPDRPVKFLDIPTPDAVQRRLTHARREVRSLLLLLKLSRQVHDGGAADARTGDAHAPQREATSCR